MGCDSNSDDNTWILHQERQEKHADIIRKLVEHENNLQNFRFTWFSAAQALLFAALGFAWEKDGVFLVSVICIIGFIAAFVAFISLILNDLAYRGLGSWWRENLADYKGPPRQGYEGKYFPMMLMPSRTLPWVFMAAWVVLLWYRCERFVPALVCT